MRSRRLRPTPLLALGLATAVALGGCGTSGRDLRDPEPGAVSPTRSAPTSVTTSSINFGNIVPGTGVSGTGVPGTGPAGTGLGGTAARSTLQLSTQAWGPGGTIPTDYSCTGPSPALTWQGVPPGTSELALVVNDPSASADGFVHWIVVGIPPTNGSTNKGEPPTGAIQLPNGAGKASWFGPCPVDGKTHTYDFTIYALAAPYTAKAGASAKDVRDDIAAKAVASATYSGTFTRAGQ